MEFTTGISPLTYKSIVEHLALCSEGLDDFASDVHERVNKPLLLGEVSLTDVRLVVACAMNTSIDWAKERRELSKIGNRPAI